MNLFREYGLSKLINALGTSTFVGGSRVSSEVISFMDSVLTEAVDMRQLQQLASQVISRHTGAEAGCVTGCSAAGIAVSVASCLTKDDMGKVASLPKTVPGPNRIIIQKAHQISGGGCSIEQLIRISGAEVVEAGEAADCALFHLHAALEQDAAGAIYVIGSRANTPGTVPLRTFIDICHEHGVPVLIDAAAQVNLRQFIDKGADLVIASSQKWLGGPTAGLIAGRADLVHACFLNGEFGIGRPMKVGKEGIAGLIGALETYHTRSGPQKQARDDQIIDRLSTLLNDVEGLTITRIGRNDDSPYAPVLRVFVDPATAGLPAWELSNRLLHGHPRIAVDAYTASEGYVTINPALLDFGDEEVIASRITEIVCEARLNPAAIQEYKPRFQVLVSHMHDWREEYPVMRDQARKDG